MHPILFNKPFLPLVRKFRQLFFNFINKCLRYLYLSQVRLKYIPVILFSLFSPHHLGDTHLRVPLPRLLDNCAAAAHDIPLPYSFVIESLLNLFCPCNILDLNPFPAVYRQVPVRLQRRLTGKVIDAQVIKYLPNLLQV